MTAVPTKATAGARSAGIDALRLVGIAAVVIGHVWGTHVTYAAIYPWHVPLFFILSGYFWTPGRTLAGELRKRWRALGVPYVTWFVILFAGLAVAHVITRAVNPHAFTNALYGGSAASRPFSAFWFVSVLFLIAIAYRWLEKYPPMIAWAVALMGLLCAYLAPDLLRAGPLGLFLVPACLIFVLSGRVLRRLRTHLTPAVGVVMVALGAALVFTGLSRPLDMKAGDFGTPGFGVLTAILIGGGLIGLAERLNRHVGERVANVIGRLSACGIAVVLSHAGVLYVLGTQPNGGWLDLAAALLLPWAFSLWAFRTRFSPLLNGASAGKR